MTRFAPRRVLEDLTGRPVRGFRCAGFSAIEQTGWFYECLLEAGYEYDSSIFPAAREHGGIPTRCRFIAQDFYAYQPETPFDYSIVMGVMDYVAEPNVVIAKVLSMTRDRVFFSFPAASGLLAWQRKLRYRARCPLFLTTCVQVERLFQNIKGAQTQFNRWLATFLCKCVRNQRTILGR